MDNNCGDIATTTAITGTPLVIFDRAIITPEEERAIHETLTPVDAADVLAGRGPMRLVGAALLVE